MKMIKEVAKTSAGGTPKKSHREYYGGGEIPWLQSGAVAQGEIFESKTFITKEGLDNSSAKLFPKNTVLVAMYGATAAQVGILRFEACTNQAVCGILPSKHLIPEYTFYYFLSQKSNLLAQAVGNAQPNINQAKIKETLIPVPPLDVQRRIVARLDAAFAALDQAQANVERCVELAGEVWESSVSKEIRAHAKEFGVCDLNLRCSRFQYGTSSKSQTEGTTPVLRMGNLQDGYIDWGSLKYTSDNDEISKYSLDVGDVLFNRTNSPEHVGKSALFTEKRDTVHAGYLIRVTPKKEALNSSYLNYFLNCQDTREYGYSVMSSSVNQANINASKLKEYQIPDAPIETQVKSTKLLDGLAECKNEIKEQYQTRLQNLSNLRASLLERAFSGEF